MTTIRFFYNGIKASDNTLQLCRYSDGELIHYPKGTITIYKRDYLPFSVEVRQAFQIDNGTDLMTDYFEKDRIRVEPTHPLYRDVLSALRTQPKRLSR